MSTIITRTIGSLATFEHPISHPYTVECHGADCEMREVKYVDMGTKLMLPEQHLPESDRYWSDQVEDDEIIFEYMLETMSLVAEDKAPSDTLMKMVMSEFNVLDGTEGMAPLSPTSWGQWFRRFDTDVDGCMDFKEVTLGVIDICPWADESQVAQIIEDRWDVLNTNSKSTRDGCILFSDSIKEDGMRDFFTMIYEEYVGDGVFLNVGGGM